MSDWETVLALAAGKAPPEGKANCKKRKASSIIIGTQQEDQRLSLQTQYDSLSYKKSFDGVCQQLVRSEKSSGRCKTCAQVVGAHILEPTMTTCSLYCTIRNIRSCLRLQRKPRSRDIKSLQKLGKKKSTYPPEVLGCCATLLQHSSDTIRGIIACDAVYYQLYYWNLVNVPAGSVFDRLDVPHPITYWGEWMDDDVEAVDVTMVRTMTDRERKRLNEMKHVYGLSAGKPTHVLEALHRMRMHESFALRQFLEADGTLLQEWRDSCRDFLCHLFAYATLSKHSVDGLNTIFKACKHIVEVGAGTGYFARLFPSLPITAYDHCTDGSNEYHARTPHFTTVVPGDSASVKLGDALILCYPPTDNNMAEEVLNRFLKTDGAKVFVHVGEFKGLTGTRAFEHLLLSQFVCTTRWSCRTWGTDAAEVSVWEPRRNSTKTKSLLVPCSWCCEKEAVRRCKILRCLSYCSESCCEKDSASRQVFLLSNRLVDYQSSDQFEVL